MKTKMVIISKWVEMDWEWVLEKHSSITIDKELLYYVG